MPMSPRLLRPRASGSAIVASDADARAYVLAVNTADGQPLEPAVQLAINDFVVGCKADGIWSAIKASCILMGARTMSGALTPLVGAAPTNNNFVSGDYNRKTGLIGNGTNKSINTGRANNADGQNDKHGAVWISQHQNPITTFAASMGAGSNGAGAFNLATNNSSPNATYQVRHHSSGISVPAGTPLPAVGFYGASRASSADFVIRANGSDTTITVTSSAPSSDNIFAFCRGFNGSPDANTFTNARLAFYSIGSNVTLSSLDSRLTTLYNAIGAAIP